jgi:hypothetical protein
MTRVDGVMGKVDNLMPGLNTPAGGREGGAIAWRAAGGPGIPAFINMPSAEGMRGSEPRHQIVWWPAACPPSTWRISPVTNPAESRYITASTTSEISPIRPIGCNEAKAG